MKSVRTLLAACAIAVAIAQPAVAQGPGAVHDKTYWRAVAAAKFAVPAGESLPQLLTELTGMLASPDPELRDDIAYSTLTQWLYRQRIVSPEECRRLLREWTRNMRVGIGESGTPTVAGRSFSALSLGILAILDTEAPYLDRAEFETLLTAAVAYLKDERDVRGFDPTLGWLHSVAHTADLLKFLGRSRHLQRAEQRTILMAIAAKLRSIESPLVDGEDERLARAVLSLAARPDFDETAFQEWLVALAPPARTEAPTPGERASDLNIRHLLVSTFAVVSADPREASSLTRARTMLLTQLRGR